MAKFSSLLCKVREFLKEWIHNMMQCRNDYLKIWALGTSAHSTFALQVTLSVHVHDILWQLLTRCLQHQYLPIGPRYMPVGLLSS